MVSLLAGAIHAASPGAYDDMWPSWSPDGQSIVFVSTRDGDPEVYVMDRDGAGARRLTTSPGRDAHPAWSPDGSTIAFQSPRQDGHTRIFVMKADGTGQRAITSNIGFCGVPAWSPDGRRLAFQCTEDLARVHAGAPWKLYVVDLAGGPMQPLTTGEGNDQVPHWSPDGAQILFYSDRSGIDQLYTVAAAGGAPKPITSAGFPSRAASWWPDGRSMLLQTEREAIPSDIYRLDTTSGVLTRLTRSRPQHGAAFASPDGRTIAFQARAGSRWRVWLMNADGTDARQLGAPAHLDAAEPLVLVSLTAESAAAFISPATGAWLGSATVPKGPHELTVSRRRDRAFVATPEAAPAAIAIVDPATRGSRALALESCSRPHDVRVTAPGDVVLAACAGSRSVVEVNASTARVQRVWNLGAEGGWFLALTPDDRKVYVPHLEGKRLTVVDRIRGTAAVALEGGALSGIDISPDGRTVWVVGHEEGRMHVVDTATDREVATIRLDYQEFGRIRFTPDGKRVLLVQGRHVLVFSAAGRQVTGRIDLPHEGKVLDISPDGARAVVSHPDEHTITILDLEALRVVSTIPAGRGPDGVLWVR
jgi:TolB protein